MRALFLFLLIAAAAHLCAPLNAQGEEQPCVYTDARTRVSCTLDGFKKLTSAAVNAEAEASSCKVRLTATEQSRVEASDALNRCIASIPPPPPPKNKLASQAGFLLTALGASAATVAVVGNDSTSNRFTFAAGGVLSLAISYWLLVESH